MPSQGESRGTPAIPTAESAPATAAAEVQRRRRRAKSTLITAGLAALVIAVLVLAGWVDPDAALAGGLLVLIGLALIAVVLVPPDDLGRHLGRVRGVTLGALGVQLGDSADTTEGEEADEPDVTEGDEADKPQIATASTLTELRWQLEMKLTYLAKHVLAPDPYPADPVPTFLTIGSLKHDGYLNEEQAKQAGDILAMREYEFGLLSESDRNLFLKVANRFVGTVRIEVFAAQVKAALATPGWRLLPAYPGDLSRRDCLLQAAGQRDPAQHHIIPVFAMQKNSRLLEKPTERLQTGSLAKDPGRSFAVVPPRSRAAGTVVNDVQVVTLSELLRRVFADRPPPAATSNQA